MFFQYIFNFLLVSAAGTRWRYLCNKANWNFILYLTMKFIPWCKLESISWMRTMNEKLKGYQFWWCRYVAGKKMSLISLVHLWFNLIYIFKQDIQNVILWSHSNFIDLIWHRIETKDNKLVFLYAIVFIVVLYPLWNIIVLTADSMQYPTG